MKRVGVIEGEGERTMNRRKSERQEESEEIDKLAQTIAVDYSDALGSDRIGVTCCVVLIS
jgi:hypothetical protein